MIKIAECITLLNQQAHTIRQMVVGVSAEQARWKPDAETWSILEVVNHLYDEEREDFRPKLKHILDRVEGVAPRHDPDSWPTERQYNQRDLETSINQFLHEREESIAWLRTLGEPDLSITGQMFFRRMSAGDMLVSWVAHDLLHQRQLVELHFAYQKEQAQPYQVDYAGEW